MSSTTENDHQLILYQSQMSKLTQHKKHRHPSLFITEKNINEMIEVIAEILRGPVFIAGETLHCQI